MTVEESERHRAALAALPRRACRARQLGRSRMLQRALDRAIAELKAQRAGPLNYAADILTASSSSAIARRSLSIKVSSMNSAAESSADHASRTRAAAW